MFLALLSFDYTTQLKKGETSDRSDPDRCLCPRMVYARHGWRRGGTTWCFEGTLRNPGPSTIQTSLTVFILSDAYEHFQMGALADL